MVLIGNGKLITRDETNPYYENGAVLVVGNRIKEVGTYELMKEKYPAAEFIDAKGMVIMPGFINAHQHIYSAFARGLSIPGNSPKNFLDILKGTWWHIDRQLTLQNVYYSAMTTYLEGIQNGVTSVFDHHASYGAVKGSLYEIVRAAKELSVRTCLAYEISDRDGVGKMKEAVAENIELIRYASQQDSAMIKGLVGLHASFTLSDETLDFVRCENNLGAGYHIHIAEGEYDKLHSERNYGKSVVKRLLEQGILGTDTVAGHCIHISEEDMDLLKETGTMVVHNPESNMGNGVGSPDILKMLDKGILTGLGTDGYTNDMLESLKVANILQKHRRGIPDRGFSEACQLLFSNNAEIAARVLGDETGSLKEGALADIIIVDYQPYTPMNSENVNGHIMFGMSGAMTDTTMINGKLLMRSRKLLFADEAEIKAKSRESAQKLWSRL